MVDHAHKTNMSVLFGEQVVYTKVGWLDMLCKGISLGSETSKICHWAWLGTMLRHGNCCCQPPFCKQNPILIQPMWQARPYFIFFLHSLSKSNFILMFVFYDWPFPHTCTLQRMQSILYSLLILGSVFSDCVVFYGDNLLGLLVT